MNQNINKSHTLWTPVFISLVAVALFSSIVANGLINSTPVYIDTLGGSARFSGICSFAYSFAACMGRFGGNLSDRFGRRRLMLTGSILLFFSTLLPILIPGLAVLLIFRIMQGLGYSILFTTAVAAASDVTPKARLGEGMGYFGLGHAISGGLGPVLAMLTLNMSGGMMFGMMTAIAALIILICSGKKFAGNAFRQAQISKPAVSFSWSNFFEPTALFPALIVFLCNMGTIIIYSYMALYTSQNNISGYNGFFLLASVVMILIRFFGGRLSDKLPFQRLIAFTAGMGAVTFLLLIIGGKLPFYLAGVGYGCVSGSIFPLLNAEMVRYCSDSRRGAASSTFYIGCDAGNALGGLLWGAVIQWQGDFRLTLIGGLIFLIITLLVGVFLYPVARRKNLQRQAAMQALS